jgi:phenylacetate-CoA ligase
MISSWVVSTLRSSNLPVSREALDSYVLDKLEGIVSYAREFSNFYKEHFKDVAPSRIENLMEFKALPFTCSEDIIAKPNWFLCVSQSEILRSYVVETLDERLKQISFTQEELEHIIDAISNFFHSIGVSFNTKVAIVFPQENLWGVPDLLNRAAKLCGAVTTLVDQNDLDQQMSAIISLKPDIIVGSAQQMFFLSALLEDSLGSQTSPKAIVPCHGCVPYLFTEKAKQLVRRAGGATLYEHFGITEMGFNVAVGCGKEDWLHLNEVDVYAETIDPQSSEPQNLGERGELVLTNIASKGMPIIRYRTGYLAEISKPQCSCGDLITKRLKIFSSLESDEDLLNRPLVFRPF